MYEWQIQIVAIIEWWKSNEQWVLEWAQEENNELQFKWNQESMDWITDCPSDIGILH